MKDYKLGLQVHSVREDFAADPVRTMHRVREMGYTGIEIPMGSITAANEGLIDKSGAFYRRAMNDAGLECYGVLTSWADFQPEKLQRTIELNYELGSGFLVIGSVPAKLVTNMDEVKAAVDNMLRALDVLRAEGITTGYHNHDSDFFNVIEGKTFFEHVFDNTPDDFVMLLDTGNALAGGFESVPLLKKYPGRSPYLHIKGYSKEKDYLAYIGEDDFNWPEVIRCALDVGGAKIFDVEFGKRSDYDPFERARSAYGVISRILESM